MLQEVLKHSPIAKRKGRVNSVLAEKLCAVAERKDRTGCLELDIKIHLKLVCLIYTVLVTGERWYLLVLQSVVVLIDVTWSAVWGVCGVRRQRRLSPWTCFSHSSCRSA